MSSVINIRFHSTATYASSWNSVISVVSYAESFVNLCSLALSNLFDTQQNHNLDTVLAYIHALSMVEMIAGHPIKMLIRMHNFKHSSSFTEMFRRLMLTQCF